MSDIDIFVSHATVDDKMVSRIHDLLEADGLNVWVDHEDDIVAGDNFRTTLDDALRTAEAGLFVMSNTSIKSVECTAEWNRILKRGAILYVVMIESINPLDIPSRIDIIQHIDLTQEFDAGMADLIKAIKGKHEVQINAPATQKRIKISGTFPRSYLDLPLIGRDDEFEQVQSLLEENNRMVSILGLGGLGKTRLAVDIATQAQFRDGVIWHTISPTTDIHRLTTQIRDHLRLDDTYADNAVWEQLNTRQCLIVLDNAEDCRQPATYASRINSVDLTSGTRFLMTSRYQWREVRTKPINLRFLDETPALAVLDAMLDREPPAFDVAGYKKQLVQSARFHPRLIEYSVGWLNHYPPEFVLKILRSLEGEDAEEMLTDIVRKTIDQMRQQENGADAITALRRLAVCRDGFTFEASQALIDDPKSLAMLKQWNLVDLDMGRYGLDPLVIKVAGIDESARQAHFDYYKQLAITHDKAQDYMGLDIESANLEGAFEWAMANDPEQAYWLYEACSDFLRNRGRVRSMMQWLKRIMVAIEGLDDARLATIVQNSLGTAYSDLSTVEEREVNLRRAIEAYQAALKHYTPASAPLSYAMTQNNLGIAYRNLSTVEEREVNLRRAIEAYQAALKHYTPASAPLSYALTQNNLGTAYRDLSEVEEPEVNLRRAIEAYQEAMIYRTPASAPLAYASTQNNLGLAYSDLSTVEKREGNLRRAIEAYQAALTHYTPASAPLSYATTQNNLGATYADLSTVEEREVNLRRAIEAYQAALTHYTPASAPLSYAMTQNNLGIAYRDLSEVEEREGNLRRAIEAYQAALTIDTRWYNLDSYWGRGNSYYELGKAYYPQAIADYRMYEQLTGQLKPFMARRIEEMERALGE